MTVAWTCLEIESVLQDFRVLRVCGLVTGSTTAALLEQHLILAEELGRLLVPLFHCLR